MSPPIEADLVRLGLRDPAALEDLADLEAGDTLGRLERLALSPSERAALAAARRELPLGPATEDLAFEVWARGQGLGSEVVAAARREVARGARFWEYLLAHEVLDLEHTPVVGRGTFRCPSCEAELELEASLVSEVPCCLVCGWLRASAAASPAPLEANRELDSATLSLAREPRRRERHPTLVETPTELVEREGLGPTLSPERTPPSGVEAPPAGLSEVTQVSHPRPESRGKGRGKPGPESGRGPTRREATGPGALAATSAGTGDLAEADDQLRVANAVLIEWAASRGLSKTTLEALRACESPAELIIREALLPTEDLFTALAGETPVPCDACGQVYLLGDEVSPFSVLVPCPRCGGLLAGPSGPTVVQAAAPLAPLAPQDPLRIGPYRVVSLLGKGGMGEVYQALDEADHPVALKVLKAKLGAKRDHVRRFEREGRALERLDHPNVVRALGRGVDEASGRAYLALELVPGIDLGQRLHQRGQLAAREAAYVLREVALALEAAHAVGLVHRDIKPGNVLLTPEGEVKVTDFGVALEEDVSLRLTAAGAVLGTPHYIAPEGIAGDAWGAPVDVYALGCTAFKLLSGRLPFLHKTLLELLDAHQFEPPPLLSELVPELDPELAALLQRTLAKDPAERPTCAELRAGLDPHAARREEVAGLWNQEIEPTLIHVRGEASGQASGVSPLSASQATLTTGQVFHHFLLKEELGRGGMGVVYRAQHLRLKKLVAVKVMLSGALAGEDEKRRFLREAESAAALSHPYVVGVLDSGEWEGNLYLAMEYFEGLPLQRYYREHPEREALLRLFLKVCQGVNHAHSRGVIHRDLKPDNVLVDAEGDPHVLDFGIAKRLDAPAEEVEATLANLTTAGDIMGTLRYMPPEQAAGRASEVDVRSDVYTLGGILYELVTLGRTPFQGNIGQMLHKIIHLDPPPPSAQSQLEVPWELDAICLKALAKEADQRYQSVRELRLDVERYLEGLPIQAKRATALYRLQKWARRNRGRLAAGLAAAALIGGLLGLWAGDRRARVASRQAALLQATDAAWGHSRAGRYREASESFELARSRLEPGEVLALPPELEARIPSELAASYLDEPTLARWKEFASQRVSLEGAHAQVSAGQDALARHDLSAAANSLSAAEGLAQDDERVRKLREELGSALRRDGAAELEAARSGADLEGQEASLSHATHLLERAQALGDKGSVALLRELDRFRSDLRRAQEEAEARREAEVHLTRAQDLRRQATQTLEAARGEQSAEGEQGEGLLAARQGARASLRESERELILALATLPRYAPAEEEKTRVHLQLADLALESEELGLAEQALMDARLFGRLEGEVAALASRIAAVDANSQAFLLQVSRGDAAFERADYALAERAYALALAQRSTPEVESRRQLCAALERAGRARQARHLRQEREALTQALALDPRDARVGARLLELRAELFQEALQAARETLADAIRAGRGFERAADAFERALALEPRDRDALRGRADAYALRDLPPGRVLISVPLERILSGSLAARSGEVLRFYLDRTEVTRAAYAEFVAEGGYQKQAYWAPAGWAARDAFLDQTGRRAPRGWIDAAPPPGTAELPVTGVSYFEAEAYARWRGVRLPTDREWRIGACFDPEAGRFRPNPWPEGLSLQPSAHLHPAGSDPRDQSPFGVLDLGFNASEWVQPEGAPAGAAGRALVRGLSIRAFPYDLAQGVDAWRKSPRATFSDESISFRCAEDVPAPPPYAPEGSR